MVRMILEISEDVCGSSMVSAEVPVESAPGTMMCDMDE
jgi:hypothetical protein